MKKEVSIYKKKKKSKKWKKKIKKNIKSEEKKKKNKKRRKKTPPRKKKKVSASGNEVYLIAIVFNCKVNVCVEVISDGLSFFVFIGCSNESENREIIFYVW